MFECTRLPQQQVYLFHRFTIRGFDGLLKVISDSIEDFFLQKVVQMFEEILFNKEMSDKYRKYIGVL